MLPFPYETLNKAESTKHTHAYLPPPSVTQWGFSQLRMFCGKTIHAV